MRVLLLVVALLFLGAGPITQSVEQATWQAVLEARGVLPTIRDARLDKIALLRAQDMADRNYFAHTPPGGHPKLRDLMPAGWVGTGEILVRNTFPPADAGLSAVRGWLGSPPHREVLLGAWETFGLAVVYDDPYFIFVVVTANWQHAKSPSPTLPPTDTE